MFKQKVITATVWSALDILLRQGLQFFVAIALARLLSPEEFGTIALLYLFVGLAGAFVDSGLSAALVQRQEITHTDESTVFWFNIGTAGAIALCLWISSPLIARFFEIPVLEPLTGVIALNLIVSALGAIHGTLLAKRLDFKTPMKIGAIATSISGGVGIFMAWQGYGVWALVMQTFTSTLLTTVLLWCFNKWRPRFEFSIDSARRLFGFGGYLLMSGLLDVSYNQLYAIVIGKFYGVSEVGFYNRAESTKNLPTGILSSILWKVALPVFSTVKSDKKKLRDGISNALGVFMLINIPIMIGLAAVADSLVFVIFGSKWLPAVPILQILAIAGIFWPLHVINLNVLVAQGYSNLFFRLELIKKATGIFLIICGAIAYGIFGIAWCQIIFGVFCFFINAHYTKKELDYGVLQQSIDFLPTLIMSASMGVFVIIVGFLFKNDPTINLPIQILSGVVFFIVGCHLFKIKSYANAICLFKQKG